MEPVFMVLGQSSATAAVHAIEQNVDIQKIDAKKLEEFREKNAMHLAVDAAGQLVYLAPTRVNLQLAQERAKLEQSKNWHDWFTLGTLSLLLVGLGIAIGWLLAVNRH